MRIFVSVIFMFALSAIADESGELVQLQNGEVADAEDINGNFELLKKLIDESSDTSCTISTADGSTTISCPDGSSSSIPINNQFSACMESDFEGVWIFSGPDFDDDSVADLEFYAFYDDKSIELSGYECSVYGCELLGAISGTWGEFDSSFCSINVTADVSSSDSARGLLFLSASKSVLTGFICDPENGCIAGSLNKGGIPSQGKSLPADFIKPAKKPTRE